MLYFILQNHLNKNQITGDDLEDGNIEENELENDSELIDIDKLSSMHNNASTTGKSCDRVDGDGSIWQKIHAEDSML